MKRRDLLAAGAAAALLPRIARGASMRAFGGELVAALLEGPPATLDRGNPRTLDPFHARTRLERELSAALHLPLIGPPSPGRPLGPIVESATRSGNEWSFVLRRDLTFHDGSPITARAVLDSLQRLPPGVAAIVDVELLQETGARTFVLGARRLLPPASLLARLAATGAPVVATAPGDPFFGPIGCGAFLPGAPAGGRPSGDVVLAANVSSPAGRSYLDRLVLTALPDATALAAALRKGTIDVATATSTAAQISGAGLTAAPATATIVLAINPQLPAARRQRIAACPDRNVLARVFLKERVRPATTLVPPSLLGPLASSEPAPAGAAQKGDKTRLSLLVTNDSPEIRDVAERLVWDLQSADVQATIGWRHPADLETEVSKGRYDLILFEWTPQVLDAGFGFAAEKGLLRAADEAFAELRADDPDARTRAARLQDGALRSAGALVPIAHPVRLLRVASRVVGVKPDAHGRVSWADVSLERGRT